MQERVLEWEMGSCKDSEHDTAELQAQDNQGLDQHSTFKNTI